MTVDVRSVHFDLGETSRAYLDSKLERIGYAKDMIVDLIFVITKEKEFKLEVTSISVGACKPTSRSGILTSLPV